MLEIIKMPKTKIKQTENRQIGATINVNGLPGIGAIDCTHIRLTNTRFYEVAEVYRNRKGYFSLNIQAVVRPPYGISGRRPTMAWKSARQQNFPEFKIIYIICSTIIDWFTRTKFRIPMLTILIYTNRKSINRCRTNTILFTVKLDGLSKEH